MNLDRAVEYLELVRQAEPELDSTESQSWFDRFDQEYGEIEEALSWFSDHSMVTEGLELATALSPYWTNRGLVQVGRKWLSIFLTGSGEDSQDIVKARALSAAGLLAFRQGDNEEARRHFERSLATSQLLDDQRALSTALLGLARVALRDGATNDAQGYVEESLAISRKSGDRNEVRMPLHILAEVSRMQGDYERACLLYNESIELNRELGHEERLPIELHNLAYVEKNLGDLETAAGLFGQSLHLALTQGNSFIIPYCLIGLGGVATADGRSERAAKLLAAGDALLKSAGVVMDPTDRPEYEKSVARIRQDMGEELFDAFWTEGGALTSDEAVAYALGEF